MNVASVCWCVPDFEWQGQNVLCLCCKWQSGENKSISESLVLGDSDKGVVITGITDNTVAAKSGLQAGKTADGTVWIITLATETGL